MSANVKMGVELNEFNRGIKEGQNILKGLNAEMKATEAEFKATGNAEKALEQKTKTLNSQLRVQKGIVDQAQKALKAMDEAGVKPTDAAYQKLYATMMNATAGMNETQAALNNLTASEQKAASGANELTNSVNGISKKISLDQVISGINSITSGLENAAKSAFNLGEELVSAVLNKAKLADDTATMAQMYGISIERLLKMNQMYAAGFDTSAEAILTSQDKLRKGLNNSETVKALEEIGVAVNEVIGYGKFGEVTKARDSLEIFFEAGQKILTLGEGQQVDIAQKLFGRSWRELKPLFDEYKTVEEYEKALDGITVASEDSYKNLATLNDTVGELKGNFDTLTMDILGALAPALTKVASSLNDLLSNVIEYLKTDDGQEMLQSLSDSMSSLFDDLGKIDPKSVVESFTSVFNSLVDGLKWIVENKDTLVDALKYVVTGWGLLKLTGGALDIIRLVSGLKGLGVLGKGGGAASAAAGGGSAAGSGTAAVAGITAGEIAQTSLFAAPFALFIDGLRQDKELVDKWMANARDSIAGYQANVEQYSGNEMFDIWDVMTRYTTVNGTPEDSAKMREFAQHFFSWWNDEITDAGLEELAGGMNDEDFFAFKDALEKILNGELLYSSEDQQAFADALNKAIEAAEGLMNPVDIDLKVTDDAAASIAEQVGVVHIPGKIDLMTGQAEGEYANGLPWVPYDGYLALLHRGERVMTARENRNYTYNSNNYFGNVNLNNGLEIDALCDSIDRHNRRQNAGFGG